MAEEIDIRSIWNKGKELEKTSTIDLGKLEKSKTKTTLYWIKIILTIELWINIVSLPFVTYHLIVVKNDTTSMIIYSAITLIYITYYLFLIRQVKQFNYDGDVLQSLKKVHGYLNFYLLHYKVVIWIGLILGMIYSYVDLVKTGELAPGFEDPRELFFWGLFVVIYSLVLGLVITYLIHLIYGRKIKRLKGTIKELEAS